MSSKKPWLKNLTKVNPELPSYLDDDPLRNAAYEGYGVTRPPDKGPVPTVTRLQHDWCWLGKFFHRNGDDVVAGVSEGDDTVYYAGRVSGPGTNWTTSNGTRVLRVDVRKLVDLQPRRKTGTRIFYQPPSPFMHEHWKLGPDFDGDALAHLRKQYPGLPVTVYEKGGNLAKALADCRLFVSFNSTAGYRALELGIDAVMTSPMTLWPYESMDLSDKDFADRREVMFAYMAGRCFEWGELEDGTAIFHMGRNGEIP